MTPASKQQVAQAMRLDVRANSVTHRLQFAKALIHHASAASPK
jgi:hypothetical protein